MSTVRELHDSASQLAQLAMVARDRGESGRAEDLARRAFDQESAAAALIQDDEASEPTRSILYLSAASLAYQCRELAKAERLAAKGLSGYPPPRIAQDLRQLYHQLVFEAHLSAQGIVPEQTDLEISLSGDAVGPGSVPYSELKKRIDRTINLLHRTVERFMGRQFQGAGRPAQKYRPFRLALSTPRVGSFAITLSLRQREDVQLTFLHDTPRIIDEVLTGIELLNRGDEPGLQNLIGDDRYLRHFVFSAREMAPDGDRISFVGLSSGTRSVGLTRYRDEISVVQEVAAVDEEKEGESVKREGRLDLAISRGDDQIGLTTDEGRLEIRVQQGMEDVVRSYFGQHVEVSGFRSQGRIILTDIRSAEE